MKSKFLRTVYDIISRDPKRTVDLAAVASETGITFEQAEHISEQLHAARLIYRFPKRRLGAGVELVITRAGVARLKVLSGDARVAGDAEDARVTVPRLVAMRSGGMHEYTDCRVHLDLDAKAVGIWRHSGAPEETLPLDSVVIDWAPTPSAGVDGGQSER
ncbi:MAG: hypothetical protein H0U67_06020 [Gemmatimonadetes bacterium]|nr:hypothetical protein [Gemmatimonadota bacterium]